MNNIQQPSDNILVLGLTGYGKSTFCNQVIGQKVFETGSSSLSVTQEATSYNLSDKITLYDLPGFGDPNISLRKWFSRTQKLNNLKVKAIFLIIDFQVERVQNDQLFSLIAIYTYFKEVQSAHIIPVFSKTPDHSIEIEKRCQEFVEYLWELADIKESPPKQIILFNKNLQFNHDPKLLVSQVQNQQYVQIPDYNNEQNQKEYLKQFGEKLKQIGTDIISLLFCYKE